MDTKKLNPWNWFSREDDHAANAAAPARRDAFQSYNPLAQLHQDIDRMFDSLSRGFGLPALGVGGIFNNDNAVLRPSVDIVSNEKEYTITVEVPGVDEKDVRLELTNDRSLIIYGEKRQEKEQKDKNVYRVERSYGSFRRTLSLPDDATPESIAASFKDGVLTIACPRRQALQAATKRIEIRKVS